MKKRTPRKKHSETAIQPKFDKNKFINTLSSTLMLLATKKSVSIDKKHCLKKIGASYNNTASKPKN